MRLYTYYHPVPELNAEDELRLLILWRHTWQNLGVETVVLNEHIARKHALWPALEQAAMAMPTVNPKLYEFSCFVRHLALAQTGGGWMADYDVFPLVDGDGVVKALWGLENANFVQVLQKPCVPCLIYEVRSLAERLCETFIAGGRGNRPQGERDHISDQYVLDSLVEEKADWAVVHDVVKQYGDDGWDKAPFVHFANAAMMPKGLVPRWKHIPELLKK